MRAWRIEKDKYLRAAKTGEGARRTGGRWNLAGTPVIYASEHLALAVLEIIANAPDPASRLVARMRSALQVPDALVEELPTDRLPADFGPASPFATTLPIGEAWLQEQRSVGLLVPSAIVPEERNLLLNPAHPRFKDVEWSRFERINLDARLWMVA